MSDGAPAILLHEGQYQVSMAADGVAYCNMEVTLVRES
jgi:hypothetical protein